MEKLDSINRDLYVFDEERGIYSKHFHSWLKGSIRKDGYVQISLKCNDGKKEKFLYHRVIAFMLCEVPDDIKHIPINELHVDHINGIRNDNRASNLRWCTQPQNNRFELFRLKCSQAKLGSTHEPPSIETRLKISQSLKGRHHTELAKMRMRNAKRKTQ